MSAISETYLFVDSFRILDRVRIQLSGMRDERTLWQCGIEIRVNDIRGQAAEYLETAFRKLGRELKQFHKKAEYKFTFPCPAKYGDMQPAAAIPLLATGIQYWIEYFQQEAKTSPELEAMFEKPNWKPCQYCGREHMEYACDKQIESIKKNLETLLPPDIISKLE